MKQVDRNKISNLEEALLSEDPSALEELQEELHPSDLADLFHDLEEEKSIKLANSLSIDTLARAMEYLDPLLQMTLIQGIREELAVNVLEEMASDDRVDVIKHLPEKERERLLPQLPETEREDIKELASYKEETAGAIMTSDFAYLPRSLTADEAIQRVRSFAEQPEYLYYLYLVDEKNRLTGILTLRDLITASPDTRIGDISEMDVISVTTSRDQEEVAELIRKYDFLALPVTDESNRLVGIVTSDDVLDVLVEEGTEDMYRYGAAGNPVDYKTATAGSLYRQRLIWLVLLVLAGFVSGYFLQIFEEAIEGLVALVFFMPILNGSGGNAGTQSSTTIVRGLATGDLSRMEFSKILWKEVRIGIYLGISLSLVALLRLLFIPGMDYTLMAKLALTVGLSMIFTVTFSTCLGAVMPYVFNRIGLDPALTSGPFIASVVDISTIIIYFSLASAIL